MNPHLAGTKTLSRAHLPGTKQISMWLPEELVKRVKHIQRVCARREGHTSHLARFYAEAIELWLTAVDPETGGLAKWAASRLRRGLT